MTTYWLSDFCSLFNSTNINPFLGEDKNFKFNSLTRLIILVTVVSALVFRAHANEILLAGGISVFVSVIIYMLTYNSADIPMEMPTSVPEFKKIAEPQIKKTKEMSDQEKHVRESLSEMGARSLQDTDANVQNEVTLSWSPPNTDLKKSSYFLEGNKMPSSVTKEVRDPKDYVSTGKQVPDGTVNQLHSLLGKNLTFT